jgi:outer membrane immunogenic protein
MLRVVTGALVLIVSASSAMAADLIIDEPEAAPMIAAGHDWSGGYIGVHLGYGWGTVEATDTDPGGGFFDEATGESLTVDASGFLAGLQAGANWQMDSVVLGIEGQVGFLGVSGENVVLLDPDNFGRVDYGAYGDLTARLGFAADTALFYLKGGLAVAQVDTTFGDIVDGTSDEDPNSTGSFSGVRAGWTVGVGAELALDDNWSVKAEYQYYDFGTQELVDIDGDTADATFKLHTVKIGLNYSF